jgi:kumamolisin
MRSNCVFPSVCAAYAAFLVVSSMDALAVAPSPVFLDDSIKPVTVTLATAAANPHKPFISRTALKSSERAANMTFEVALKMRNFSEFKKRVDQGEHVSPAEMVEKYEPLAADYQATEDWLKSEGFTIVRRSSHHLAIFASGNVDQIAQSLQVNFARVTLEGKEYTSALTAPSVPASIASALIGINGLQPHIHAHKHLLKQQVHPNASSGTTAYTPNQIAQAYDATGLYNANITGTGQTIAIVIDTFPAKSDLIQFWNQIGVQQSINNIQFIQVISGTLPSPSGEETLDTEWSSAVAPGAKVRVYAVADADLPTNDLDMAYNQIIDDATTYGIHEMSMSYGIGESDITSGEATNDDQLFATLAGKGVTVFASSGDEGPTPDIELGSSTPSAESPASDPYVTGVGGTSLTLDSNNNESSEVVWNDGASGGASGGGASKFFAHSTCTWQTTNGVAVGAMREVPDIACAADPDFGAYIYLGGSLSVLGGTSWSSPTCAGFAALINQECAIVGSSPVAPLAPHLYAYSGTANFRNITSGNNSTAAGNGFSANANGTYNEATGIGVPLIQTLAETLAGTQTLVTPPPAAVTVNQGQNATFTVTTTGTPISYQWQRMPIGSTTWTNLSNTGVYSGATTTSLTVSSTTTAMSGDQFQCTVGYSGTAGVITSAQPTALIVETPWTVSTLAGNAGSSGSTNNTGTSALFDYPTGIAVDNVGNAYVADCYNNVIRKVTSSGVVTTPYGSGTEASANGTGTNASFDFPRDITIDSTSSNLYVSDEGSNEIRKISLSTGQVTTIGTTASPAFFDPKGICVDTSGNVYVADSGNNVVRKIAVSNGAVTVVAGSSTFAAGYADGTATSQALFNEPLGLAIDGSGNLYVTDYSNQVIRKISNGVVSTFAGKAGVGGCLDGTGTQSEFNVPRGIVADSSGNLYVTDSYAPSVIQNQPVYTGNNLLRKITSAGVVTTLAGDAGVAGSVNNVGAAAEFYNPCGVTMDASGNLYVADAGNNTIRFATLETNVSVAATQPYASVVGSANGQFTVTRTGGTESSLAVNYSLSGTAIANTDYSTADLTGTVTIPAGASSATIAVIPLSNSAGTTNQTVTLTLANSGVGVIINSTPATVTILEAAPVQFSDWVASFANPLTGPSAQPSAIPLNDGIPNVLKYVSDINPGVPLTATTRAELPSVNTITKGGATYLTLTYEEYAGLTGTTVNVQTSPDLQTWTTVNPPDFDQVLSIDPNSGNPIIEVGVISNGNPEQFIRLDVTQP